VSFFFPRFFFFSFSLSLSLSEEKKKNPTPPNLTWHPLFFFTSVSDSAFAIWSTTKFTCVPPFVVQIPLTKDTWLNWPSEGATTTSHLSPTLIEALGVSGLGR
jgi:hypothetical protein